MSPAAINMAETLSTLRFADQAKRIRNQAVVNEDTDGNVAALKREIRRLHEELAAAKRAGAAAAAAAGTAGLPAAAGAADSSAAEAGGTPARLASQANALLSAAAGVGSPSAEGAARRAALMGALRREDAAVKEARRLETELEGMRGLLKVGPCTALHGLGACLLAGGCEGWRPGAGWRPAWMQPLRVPASGCPIHPPTHQRSRLTWHALTIIQQAKESDLQRTQMMAKLKESRLARLQASAGEQAAGRARGGGRGGCGQRCSGGAASAGSAPTAGVMHPCRRRGRRRACRGGGAAAGDRAAACQGERGGEVWQGRVGALPGQACKRARTASRPHAWPPAPRTHPLVAGPPLRPARARPRRWRRTPR